MRIIVLDNNLWRGAREVKGNVLLRHQSFVFWFEGSNPSLSEIKLFNLLNGFIKLPFVSS